MATYALTLVPLPAPLSLVLGAFPAPPPEPPPEPVPEPQPAAARDWNRSATTTAARRRDALLDPRTGDYLWQLGRQQRAQGAESRVYLALATQRGAFFGNPDLGSQLHELRGEKSLPTRRVLAEDFAREALAQQVRDGLLRSLVVTAELDPDVRGRINLHITATDGLSGRPIVVIHPVG